jgi:hypothetical protein
MIPQKIEGLQMRWCYSNRADPESRVIARELRAMKGMGTTKTEESAL